MDVMNLPSNTVVSLLDELQAQYPTLAFVASQTFYWSPKEQAIHYRASNLDEVKGQWALLHEVAHALLLHSGYHSDFELLECEVLAWEKAKELALQRHMQIDNEHIEDCLDTYRDWLYARSTCPTCHLNSLQIKTNQYQCVNCLTTWRVSASRFCRPYRMQASLKTTLKENSRALFH